jgi:hypothetical protein
VPADDHGEKTTDDLPVFEMTEEEIERDFPEWAKARQLKRDLARYSRAGNRPGDPGAAQPSPSNSSANTSKAIFTGTPQPVPSPPQPARPPPSSG